MIDSKMYVGIRDVGIADMAPSKKDVVSRDVVTLK